MKSILLVILILVTNSAQASSSEVMSSQKFLLNVKNYLMHLGSDRQAVFEGELTDIGGTCTVSLEQDTKGRSVIVLKSDKDFQLKAVVRNEDTIKLKSIESEDGSFEHTYSFGFAGINQLVVTNHDDAGYSILLKSGPTSLVCEVNF